VKPLILGTRGSDLALAQTRLVATRLRATHPGLVVEERIIRTTGDARLDIRLSAPGSLDKGLFTRELEEALLRGEIDAAVHSLKDLPTEQPAGLAVGAILEREGPEDVLLTREAEGLDDLPAGAQVGTSSLRRKCFLLWKRPDLEVVEIRGNVPTRIRKLAESTTLDAIVLAGAGLRRLQAVDCPLAIDDLSLSPLDFMLPAPGQGAIALQCREGESSTGPLAALHHAATAACVDAERAILAGLGGGCHLPLGALAEVDDAAMMTLRAAWFGAATPRLAERRGPVADWQTLAAEITADLSA